MPLREIEQVCDEAAAKLAKAPVAESLENLRGSTKAAGAAVLNSWIESHAST